MIDVLIATERPIMIKELFLPQKIKGKRVRSERCAGIHIQDKKIFLIILYLTPSKSIIEKAFKRDFPLQDADEKQLISAALKEYAKEIKRCDYVTVTLASALGVYKELTVPFKNHEKISMILDFELEPLLPFSLQQGIADFIITKSEATESRLFTVSVRKQDLENELALYSSAGIDPDVVVIDFYALYGLYLLTINTAAPVGSIALIDLGDKVTRLAILHNNELRAIRTIQQGLNALVSLLMQEFSLTEDECRSKLTAFALDATAVFDKPCFEKSVTEFIMKLLQEIQFSLDAFSLKFQYSQGFEQLLFTQQSAKINNFFPFCAAFLQTNTAALDSQNIFTSRKLINKSQTSDLELNEFCFSLGAVLAHPIIEECNLRKKEFLKDYSGMFMRAAIATFFLLLMLFGVIITKGYFEIQELAALAHSSEEAEIKRLKKIIPAKKLPKKITLQNLVNQAEKIIKERSDLWAPFSDEYISPLEVLGELTKLIDKKLFDVRMKETAIILDKNKLQVTLEGHFKSLTGKDNYAYFGQFKKRFNESLLFELDGDVNERPEEDLGIPFTVKLKPKTL